MKLIHNKKIKVHPGEALAMLLEEVGTTQTLLAETIGVTQSYISDIINGKRNMTAVLAYKLSAAIGLTPETWMNLQKNWELSRVKPDVAKGIKKIAA